MWGESPLARGFRALPPLLSLHVAGPGKEKKNGEEEEGEKFRG